MTVSTVSESEDLHRTADHQVSLVGSVSQAYSRIRQPASRVDADVAPLVRSHGVNHVEHHLKQTELDEEHAKENCARL